MRKNLPHAPTVEDLLSKALIGVVVLLSLSCTELTRPEIEPEEFYPLQVGNRWTFRFTNPGYTGTYTEEIVGTKRIGGHEYVAMVARREHLVSDTSFIRSDGEGRVYIFINRADQLLFDFYQDTASVWVSYEGYRGKILEKNANVTVPAGKFSNCIKIFLDIFWLVDDEQWFTFARGVGLIEKRTSTLHVRLVSARVGDRLYP